MGTIIDVNDPRLTGARFFDCRSALTDPDHGHREFLQNHIPGALYADVNVDLSAPVVPGVTGRHPLPIRQAFVATARSWGLGRHDIIVAYDDGPGAFAARLWWLMRWIGHQDVFVLDGGLSAWIANGHPVTRERIEPTASDYRAMPPLTRQLDAGTVQRWQGVLMDARDPVRFRGESEPIDPVAGHIPGAINCPFPDNLTGGRFKSASELRSQYSALGVDTSDTACYCGSGVTAAHNILAIVHAGLPEPALYPGSWSEWITDPERPVARGQHP